MKNSKKTTKNSTANQNHPLIGKPVIIRSKIAGVHMGRLTQVDPTSSSATLEKAARLWRIHTRDKTGSISDVAAHGLKEPVSEHSIGAVLNSVYIINPEGLEVAEATEAAYASVLRAAAKA